MPVDVWRRPTLGHHLESMEDSRRVPPRLLAALVFGGAGMLLPALWFGASLADGRGGLIGWLLYLILPGVSGAVAGAAFGRPLAAAPAPGRDAMAALRGIGIAAAALILFAPVFACVMAWTTTAPTNIGRLSLAVLAFSVLAMGWALAAVGALAGWILYRWSRRGRAWPEV
jgi:hypothetical protein